MPENAESLVLEHLRHIRGSVDRIEHRLDDLTTRAGHLETYLAHVRNIRFALIISNPASPRCRMTNELSSLRAHGI
jgi:hypothetical protein